MSLQAVDRTHETAIPPLAVALTAHRVQQTLLLPLLREVRSHLDCHLTLVLDTLEGVDDLTALAEVVDVLSFSARRRGLGGARRAALQAALATGAPRLVVCDGDGQHRPGALRACLDQLEQGDWGTWEAAIPQRSQVDLPLEGAPGVNRYLAERFETWCIAHGSGRPHLTGVDTQPGAFVLKPRGAQCLLEEVRDLRYAWDLEASFRLMQSELALAWPTLETFPQVSTSFTAQDSLRNLHTVCSWLTPARVAALGERFCATVEPDDAWSSEDLGDLASRIQQTCARLS